MAKRARPRNPRPALPAQRTVERKIYFYRADCGLDAGGQPLPFDPLPTCRHINGLPFTEAGRYLANDDDGSTCCWIDRTNAPLRMRVGSIRRGALPQVEEDGQLSELQIPAGSGLAEQIHVVFFPNNIVGAEFNFYGPRLSRLATYIRSKAVNFCPTIEFLPLFRQDVLQQLNQMRDVRLFDLKRAIVKCCG